MSALKKGTKIIAVATLLLCYGYIAYKLANFKDWQTFTEILSKSPFYLIQILLLQLGLAIVNLGIESKKWQCLLNGNLLVKFKTSFKMVLAGFSSGIFTPGKIGEPIGRLMSLPKEFWGKGTVLTYFGGVIHNTVIFIFGITCSLLLWSNSVYHPYQKVLLYVISVTVFIVLIVISGWYFKQHIKAILQHFNLLEKFTQTFKVLKTISIKKGLWILSLSAIRFCIYSLQLFLFLKTFGDADLQLSFILLIPIYYMAITLIPSFLLADIGIRSSVALLLFSTTLTEPAIVLSVFMTWVINQVIPALTGSILFYGRSEK